MLEYVLNFFYPPRCAACGERQPPDADHRVCARCLARIERLADPLCEVCGIPLSGTAAESSGWCVRCAKSPPRFGRARAIARYRPSASDDSQTVPSIIRRHKYGLDQSLGHALAECLGESIPLVENDYDIVIPVPLHRGRLRWRGFNQAALLGAAVARRIRCPLDVGTLVRVRATAPQTSQDHDKRRLNVCRAFAVRRPARVANRRVLLVDDVMTTGATADECAGTLLAAGARRVDVFTLARAL
ncbi:MAG: double zinc ribbon domain-containing protein [Candidatus Binataceae bacterium]